jgi:hypothetical protein
MTRHLVDLKPTGYRKGEYIATVGASIRCAIGQEADLQRTIHALTIDREVKTLAQFQSAVTAPLAHPSLPHDSSCKPLKAGLSSISSRSTEFIRPVPGRGLRGACGQVRP